MKFSLKKSILFLCALAITCLTVGLLGMQTKVYAGGEETPHIITEETASIRLDEYKGIRFSSKVSVDYLKTIEGEFEVGTLIVPASYVAEGKQLDASVADAIVINHTARFNDLENLSGVVTVNAVLTEIPDEFVQTDLLARAFIKTGQDTYEYSEVTANRSILFVASCALNNKAKYNENEIATLRSTVNAYAKDNVTAVGVDETLTLEYWKDPATLNSVITRKNADDTSKVQLEYESSDPSVATVDGNGVVTATGRGNAQITVRLGDHTAACAVTVNALDFLAKDPTKMVIEEVTEGDFAGSVKVQSTANDYNNRLLFYGVNEQDGSISDGVHNWWQSKYVTFDIYYSGQAMQFDTVFSANGATYTAKFTDGALDEVNRVKVYTKKGYAAKAMQQTLISSTESIGNWYTVSLQLQGSNGYSSLAGLVIWGDNPAPIYVKNLRVLDAFPTAKTAVNPLGFSSSDETMTVTAVEKDGEKYIEARGNGQVFLEDVFDGSNYGEFFLTNYTYISFDIYYAAGNNFNFNTVYADGWHNANGYPIGGSKPDYFRVYDMTGTRVANDAPLGGTWYKVYYYVQHVTWVNSHINIALQDAADCVYLRNLAFATAFPDA